MFRYLIFAFVFFLLPLVPATAEGDRYAALHRAALAGERPVDWTVLRYAYSESSALDLFGVGTMSLRKQMGEAFTSGDLDTALEKSSEILEKEYFDIEAQYVCGYVWHRRGDKVRAESCYENLSGIVRSIMTGDGKTAESAFTVIAIREEYSLLNFLGYEVRSQSVLHHDGHSFDLMDVVDEDGQAHQFYFQIDRIWANYDGMLGKKEN